MQVVHTCSCG